MKSLRMLLTILAMLAIAPPSSAQFADYYAYANGQAVYGPTPPQSLDLSFTNGSYNSNGRGRAVADRGVLTASSWIENIYECVCTPQAAVNGLAMVQFALIEITGPPGPVTGTLNVALEGRMDWSGSNPWGAGVSVWIFGGLIGEYAGTINGPTWIATGLLASSGAEIDTTFQFPFTVEPGVHDLTAQLDTGAGGTSFGSGLNMGMADFFTDRNGDGVGGLHFPTDGPAVTLPEGYFANSIDLNIVNNYWRSPTVSVADRDAPRTLSLRLGANPVRPGTEVRYALPRAGHVRIEVLDVQGRSIAVLENGWRPAGEHRVTWPRNTERGVYFVRATFEGQSQSRKAAILE